MFWRGVVAGTPLGLVHLAGAAEELTVAAFMEQFPRGVLVGRVRFGGGLSSGTRDA